MAKRGGASRVPASPGAPHEGGDGGESDPLVFGAGAPREEGKVARPLATFPLPSPGVALTTVIPGGKAIEHLFALTVDECPPRVAS